MNVTKIGHQQHQQYLQQSHQFRMCTGMHVDKEPLNMISNVLAMYKSLNFGKCINVCTVEQFHSSKTLFTSHIMCIL